MVGLKDLIAVLDRWDVWKRVSAAPDRLDELEKRVAALEEKLGGEWPAEVCKACGKRALRLYHSSGGLDRDPVREEWACRECGVRQHKVFKPS